VVVRPHAKNFHARLPHVDLAMTASLGSLVRKPSAFVPIVMSALALGLIAAVLVGAIPVTPTGDEGTPARLFQLLLVLQVPIIVVFATKWLPRSPRPALVVLMLQAAAALSAIGTIVWLEW
jgi:hypothetical protein